jgi:hypothetical protein
MIFATATYRCYLQDSVIRLQRTYAGGRNIKDDQDIYIELDYYAKVDFEPVQPLRGLSEIMSVCYDRADTIFVALQDVQTFQHPEDQERYFAIGKYYDDVTELMGLMIFDKKNTLTLYIISNKDLGDLYYTVAYDHERIYRLFLDSYDC